ncbi:L,D-transpeptidase [Bacillus sp. Marseille-Q1617]|uniref:L,D-transpeptidase n=1 Tax=Bacillus sp. Marseille-Q1617 TaxID=2736887 RepID=UPI00158CCBBD|nr:L,D-transpeptidase [Bacillus sp. Marseille-Q1617]
MSLFESHVKKNLMRLHRNVYVSRDDPQYYEKVLRYKDPDNSEAHYYVGKKCEEEGALVKAYLHYKHAADAQSPYYFQAKRAYKSLEERINPPPRPLPAVRKKIPVYMKSLIVFLILFNLFLVAILFWKADSLRAIASNVKGWGTDKEVVYETEDIPYVVYFPEDTTLQEVEDTIYNKVVRIGKGQSNKSVLLYGVWTADPGLSLKVLPLKSDRIKSQAFVMAEYNSAIDDSVKIRFLNSQQAAIDPYSNTYIGTNLLRTALEAYINEKGSAPPALDALVDNYPNNYLSYIPKEQYLGSNGVSPTHSGKGGWVYDPHAPSLEKMVYPNITDAIQIPFHPVEVIVDKRSFTLMVKSSPYLMELKQVGLGRNDSTPEGTFTVLDRVVEPVGISPDMFGAAGLGMGDYAIHGTYEEDSIGKDRSLGCIRLSNEDVQDIFDIVPKGAVVRIVDNPLLMTGYKEAGDMDAGIPEEKSGGNQSTKRIFGWAG